eukprot:5912332-Prymnesium_polylepis.1
MGDESVAAWQLGSNGAKASGKKVPMIYPIPTIHQFHERIVCSVRANANTTMSRLFRRRGRRGKGGR